MICPDYTEPVEKYSKYKARMFNRYKVKARMLSGAIPETSLSDGDKQKLLKLMIKEFENNI